MSTNYYYLCEECKVSSASFHCQQAWGSWVNGAAHGFLREHRDHKPVVVSERDDRTSEILSDYKRFLDEEPSSEEMGRA